MKGIIVTPHKSGAYDSCVFSERDGEDWEYAALEYAYEVLEGLWNDISINGKITVSMEYRELIDDELEDAVKEE